MRNSKSDGMAKMGIRNEWKTSMFIPCSCSCSEIGLHGVCRRVYVLFNCLAWQVPCWRMTISTCSSGGSSRSTRREHLERVFDALKGHREGPGRGDLWQGMVQVACWLPRSEVYRAVSKQTGQAEVLHVDKETR